MNWVKYVAIVVVSAAVAAAVVYIIKPKLTAPVENSIVTVDQIKKVAQLATVEYHLSTLLEVKQGKAWYE